jgi:hypothetical protein
MYLNDNEDYFYQGVNTNHDFGGWEGNGGFACYRPLNVYLNLSPDVNTENGARVFQCPSDRGGILGCPPAQQAYDYFGNSYQTNILLIGPDQIGVPNGPRGILHQRINAKLRRLNCASVDNSSHLLLVGDDPWVTGWMPQLPHRLGWHDKKYYNNLAFLDSHVEFINIRKGLYVTDEYSVLPFKELYGLAYEVQKEEY